MSPLKLQEVQCNMSKMTGCFIKLLSQLPNILKTNGVHKDEKLEAIQTILDGIKMSGHAPQTLVSIQKNSYYLGWAVNTRIWPSLLRTPTPISLGEELEDSLKKPKEGIIVCRHSNLRQTICILQLSKNSMNLKKMIDQPKDPWLATRAPHSSTSHVDGQK